MTYTKKNSKDDIKMVKVKIFGPSKLNIFQRSKVNMNDENCSQTRVVILTITMTIY